MKFFSSWSIQKKLLLLIFVAVLPALGIILFSGLERRESEIASTKRDILHLVQSLAAQQEQLAVSTRLLLQTLAQLPEVQNIDAKACNRIFRDIQAQNPIYSTISAATPDGNTFAASAAFTPGSVNLADRKHIRDAIRTRDFSAGEYIVGRVSRVPSINFTYPLLDKNRKVIAILIAGIKLDKYKEFMAQVNLPEGFVMGITDHKNLILYRFPGTEDIPPGTPLPPRYIQKIPVDSKEGYIEALGMDSMSRIYAYKRLSLHNNEPAYLGIYLGVDKNMALHQANMELAYNLVFLGIACLFAMLLASIAGNSMIVEPLDRLVVATQRFGAGELDARIDLPRGEDELGRLAKSFDTMAVMLDTKDLERRKAEEALRRSEENFRSSLDDSPLGVRIVTMEGETIYANRAILDVYGYDSVEEMKTTPSKNRYTPQSYAEFQIRLEKRKLGDYLPSEYEISIVRKNGEIRHLQVFRKELLWDGERQFQVIYRDITVQKQVEDALHESEEKFRVLVENANDIVYSLTSDGVFTYVSPTWTRILGHDISEVENHPFQTFVHPEDLPECLEFLERTINTGNKQAGVEYRVLHIDGNWRWHTTNASPIHNANGEVVAFMGIARDITERKRMEEALRESEEKRLLALNGAEMGMWDLDISTMSGTTDEKAAQILGYQKDDILPKIHDWDQMTHPDDVPRIKECIQAHIEGRMPVFKTDHRMRTASGEWKWVHGRGKITKRHMDGSPIRISGTIHDITERKLAEEKLAYFAIHDQLTGLLNRRSFEDMLNRTIARAKRGAVSSILYMDLDNFKEVNDSVGHSVGDKVLITLAGLLKNAVRTEDIVFRLGGDEFAVLLDGMTGSESLPAAERLRAAVEAHRFELEGHLFPLTLSIGLKEIDGALTMGELLSQADIAMYRAKAQGKNRVVIS